MRVFKKFNASGNDVCPVCKTAEIKETVLVAVLGTQKENIYEAVQVHLDCLELAFDKKLNLFYQKV